MKIEDGYNSPKDGRDYIDIFNGDSDSEDDWGDLIDEVYQANEDKFQAKVKASLEKVYPKRKPWLELPDNCLTERRDL